MTAARLPSLTALRAFEAAARHGSMTRAAEALHVSHGAVSRQVAALEADLGRPLFLREKRGLRLTAAGVALGASLTQAFGIIREGVRQVETAGDDGPLVISCSGTLMLRWLIPRLPRFRKAQPSLEVRLVADSGPADFTGARTDLAIRLVGRRLPAGLAGDPLFDQAFGPVCAPKLQQQTPIRQPADLAGHRLLESETRPPDWAAWLKAQKLDPSVFPVSESYEHFYFLLQAADAGLGVALGIAPSVDGDLRSGRLVAPLGLIPSGYRYVLLRPAALPLRPQAETFRAWLLQEAEHGVSTR